jgi:hypothetical protein
MSDDELPPCTPNDRGWCLGHIPLVLHKETCRSGVGLHAWRKVTGCRCMNCEDYVCTKKGCDAIVYVEYHDSGDDE